MIAQTKDQLARDAFDRLSAFRPGDPRRADVLRDLKASNPVVFEEVSSLLAVHDQTHDFFDSGVLNVAAEISPGLAQRSEAGARGGLADASNVQIGRYRIIRAIGEGGMGVVYEAQQENPRRSVALKLLRTDLLSRSAGRRFELEAAVLGKLHHPGIAQIYEAGYAMVGSSERMFIAMELLDGPNLAQYAKSGNLSTEAMLTLMAKVADAVAHAHQRGVVHRDLKPANVVIEKNTGQPKVLDFGVARLATDADEGQVTQTMHTRAGQLLGTLEYMSPEQLAGDQSKVDARSDVYALGVMLYELLSGNVPISLTGKDLFSAIDTVRAQEPTRLSRVATMYRGEVDDIVAMALEKDPQRRYQSAQALAEDLRRYLRHDPVTAHKQTAWYQARKFVQRHRVLVGAVSAVIVALSGGLVAALTQAERASRAQRELAAQLTEVNRLSQAESVARAAAEQETRNAQAVTTYLVTLLGTASPEHTKGKELTIREALTLAAGQVETEFAKQPKVQQRLFDIIRQTYYSLGDLPKAEDFGKRSLALAKQIWPEDALMWGSEVGDLAVLYEQMDRSGEAEALVRDALPAVIAQGGEDHELTATLKLHLGCALRTQEKFAEAEPLIRAALAHRERTAGPEARETMVAVNDLSLLLKYMAEYDEALQLARRNRDTTARTLGEDNPDTLAASANLMVLLDQTQQIEDAVALGNDTFSRSKRVLGEQHPNTLMVALNLGNVLLEASKADEAVALYESTLSSMRTVFGEEHQNTLNVMNNLAICYERTKRLDDAAKMLQDLSAIMLRKEPTSLRTAVTLGNRGRIARQRSQFSDAVAFSKQAYDIVTGQLPEGHVMRERMTIGYACALLMHGEVAQGLALAEPAYQAIATSQGAANGAARSAAKGVADCLEAIKHEAAGTWRGRADRSE